ncbi:hypothetical protein [Mucilaginibacter sp. SG564]|uniref:hypothetical protein n=1 Tax=unclassified Mucilaginibacter TaxID=2617802 RepID=UPI001556F27B|nr:hypothetical protein [Mucilaginibacter sp. SG564]NOW97883.1 hypothetical protein [Mucilaginibacter sp. SG564]
MSIPVLLLFSFLVDNLTGTLSLEQGPEAPEGGHGKIYIDNNHILYLILTGKVQIINPKHSSKSILLDKDNVRSFSLEPYKPEFMEQRIFNYL